MTRAGTLLAAALLLAPAANAAEPAPAAAPFLWEVQGPKARHFLLGSVHLLPPSAHPLPPALDAAYAASEAFLFEADLDELGSPAIQNRMLGAGREDRPGGLKARVGASLYDKLQKRAAQLGMPTPVCDELRAWFCALALELYPLQQAEFSLEYGIDQHFYVRAREDGRAVSALETAEFQIKLFTDMPEPMARQLLAATLDESTYSSQTPAELERIWRTGDVATMGRLMKDFRRRYPELYARLMTDRNRAWLPTLLARLQSPTPHLVIVGAAHYVGADGLLALLKTKGFDAKPASTVLELAAPRPVSRE